MNGIVADGSPCLLFGLHRSVLDDKYPDFHVDVNELVDEADETEKQCLERPHSVSVFFVEFRLKPR